MKVKARVLCVQTVEVEVDDKFGVFKSWEEEEKLSFDERYALAQELECACWDEANHILGGDVSDVYRVLDGESGIVIYEKQGLTNSP